MFGRVNHLLLIVSAFCMLLATGARAVDPDLIVWYEFEETSGTTAVDSSDNGLDGTLTDAVTVAGGQFGRALDITDGGYVDIGNPPVLDFATEDWAVTAWYKTSMSGVGDANKGCIVGKGGDTGGGHRWCLIMSEDGDGNEGHVSLVTDDDSTKYVVTSTSVTNDDEWHFVAGQRAGGTLLEIYIDGTQEATAAPAATYDLSGTTQHNAYVGAITNHGSGSLYKTYEGLVDDVRVYNGMLNAEDMQEVMAGVNPDLASTPSPGNQAVDVAPATALSWTASEGAVAHDVYLGTVAEDVIAASRTDARGVLVSQGQTETSYTPDGLLDLNTTYYWRVDEVTAAPSNTILEGDVWSFTTEPFAYPIEGVVATTNALSTAGQEPINVVNGSGLDENDGHSIESTTMWTAVADGNEAPYIQFDFDRVYKMDEMIVWNHNLSFEALLGIGLKDITVEYSVDGADWMVFGDIVLPQAPGNTSYTGSPVALDGIAAKSIRLMINSPYGTNGQIGLSEIRFMYIPSYAREPEPADGATDVDVASILDWRDGRDAASHEVLLGTDADALELVATTTDSRYNPGGLQYGTSYTWQVIEVNGEEAWDSAVWTFSTQAFAVVDDFESYDDDIDAGTTIWQSWIDGIDDASHGGAVVGYAQSPFAEMTTVRSGLQAMPFFFSTALSEADHNLSPAQDWTALGLKSLSLWFYGAEGNTGTLYVKINGTKVVYPGNPADIAKTVWQPFNVDLTTIAGAGSVSTLTIGVEGAGADQGTLYIDDIRLYPQEAELIIPVEPDNDALLARYEFEGNANDSSGNGLNGTMTDAQVVAGGQSGMAVEITDGGYVDLGNPAVLDFATEDWATTAWFKTSMFGTGDANKGNIVGKGGDTGGGHRWCLILSELNEGVVSLICDDDVYKVENHSTSVVNDDEWHFVAGQRVGLTTEIYIDGILENVATNVPENYDLSGTVQHNAYIGAITNHGTGELYKTYEGLIDDVRIYHRSLTAGEILWLSGESMPKPKPF